MNVIDIQISESYKLHPKLDGEVTESKKEFTIKLGKDVGLSCLVDFEKNDESIRIIDIRVINVDKKFGTNVSISINTMGSFHDGKEAMRLTFNMSSSGLFSNEVGNCILKLTAFGIFQVFSRTENVIVIL